MPGNFAPPLKLYMRKTGTVQERPTSSPRATLVSRENDRTAARVFVRLPASIAIDSSPHHEHVAFVRDISPRGIFFYSDFSAIAGEPITFLLRYSQAGKRVKLHLSGTVLRVEQATPSSAIGIAVAFDCEHEELPRSLVSSRSKMLTPVAPTQKASKPKEIREVLIQERGAQTPLFTQECRADELPKLGAKFSVEDRNFVVMEKRNLLLKRHKTAVRTVLLIVEDFDALSW